MNILERDFYKIVTIVNCAIDIVNFCYSDDGNWIGTENIRKSTKFLNLVTNLRDALLDNSIEKFIERTRK